jgi:hypothetical protein
LSTTIELQRDAPTGLEPPLARAAPGPGKPALNPDQQILSIRASVPKAEAGRFIGDALHDIRIFMQEHDVSPAGPPFSICRPRGSDLDIEAGWPTAGKPLASTSRIHSGTLPRSLTGPRDRPSPVDGWVVPDR